MLNSPFPTAEAEPQATIDGALQQAFRVTVRAPGRLHLGFLDPAATLGRRFGSLGLVIEGFETVVQLAPAPHDAVSAAEGIDEHERTRAAEHLHALRAHTGLRQPLHLHLARLLPAHAGFGSGTQLALAVGRAFAQLHGLGLSTRQIAACLGRGLRSGVGIGGFDHGGLLLDGGPNADHSAAPLTARLDFPATWRIVLAIDPQHAGLSGAGEKQALAALPPFPREAAAEICHRLLMQVLPGAASGDFSAFAEGLTRMQQLLGDHFAPAQGGRAYTSPAVARFMAWTAGHTRAALGQSSWGPTGFAFVPSTAEAEALVRAARDAGAADAALVLPVVRGRNAGATVSVRPSSPGLYH
jgi:beta-ribofuranosylaminobenzene 5'-phosphate synthase